MADSKILSFFPLVSLSDFGFGNSPILGGNDRGPLFSIKNSSVVLVFSFRIALPASPKDAQEVKKSASLGFSQNTNVDDLAYEKLKELWEEFEDNHEKFAEKGNKAAGGRARKSIGEIKKLVTEYRKASVAESK